MVGQCDAHPNPPTRYNAHQSYSLKTALFRVVHIKEAKASSSEPDVYKKLGYYYRLHRAKNRVELCAYIERNWEHHFPHVQDAKFHNWFATQNNFVSPVAVRQNRQFSLAFKLLYFGLQGCRLQWGTNRINQDRCGSLRSLHPTHLSYNDWPIAKPTYFLSK